MTYSTSKKKSTVNSKIFLCLIYILYSLIVIKNITARKFTFRFKTNEYSQIIFYEMELKEKDTDEGINGYYDLKILYGYNGRYYDDTTPYFIYEKKNSVNFEVLDFILASKITENEFQYGIVECNYNLIYVLRLTRDVTEVTNRFNNYQFECMLMTLEALKAVKNKNCTKLLEALIFNSFFYLKNYECRKNNSNLMQILNFGWLEKIDFDIKKHFISGFLGNLMIRFVFYDDNLIIFAKSKEIYDVGIFDEHIPYKNLLINNFEAFCRIENILKQPTDKKIFQTLLEKLNITSLILNNFPSNTNSCINLSYLLLSIDIFKAVTISNFKTNFLPSFLNDILCAIQKNIEFFGLKNIMHYTLNIMKFIKYKKLKGLILSNMHIEENPSLIDYSTNLCETLEYIDFRCVDLNDTFLNYFFQNMNTNKIILHFDDTKTEDLFLKEFYKSKFNPDNVLYFEVKFNLSVITEIFCDSLVNFKNLKTLKLDGYIIHEDIELHLYNSIFQMKKLECLFLFQNCRITKPYDFLLQNSKIKYLHLQNIFIDNDTIMINFFKVHRLMSDLSLKDSEISVLCLKEVFSLESLIHLSLDIVLNPPVNQNLLDFKSRNIHTLDLSNETLKLIEGVKILSKLACVDSLRISKCNPSPGYLSKLNDLSSSSVQELTYEYGVLDSNDLNRIGKLEVLRKLSILDCKFSDCNFFDLVNNCRFSKSLEILSLWIVNMKIEDFKYLKKFRRLNKIASDFTQFDLLTFKLFLVPLEICQVNIFTVQEVNNYKILCSYLSESNIYVIRSPTT